jgi:endo-1,3-1,4-beta-glycanase ExoK
MRIVRSRVRIPQKHFRLILLTTLILISIIAAVAKFTNGDFFRGVQNSYADQTTPKGSWLQEFNGNSVDSNFWDVSNGAYNMGAITNEHQGYFQPDRVSTNGGYLALKLTQERGQVGTNANGIISRGGELGTKKTYGYGTYEWRMRMSSTASSPTDTTGKVVSGQISSGFTYVNNSETEVDFEVEGQFPDQLEMTTWKNTNTATDPTDQDQTETAVNVADMANQFKTYKFVWSPGEIKYSVDDKLVADQLTHVGTAPANFMINHWGTDSTDFGGLATVGTDRYELVDWARYTAPGDTPIPPSSSSNPSPTPTSPATTAAPNLVQNGSFESGSISPWYFNQTSGATGSVSLDSTTSAEGKNSARIDVTRANTDPDNAWYIQFGQNNLPLVKGRNYTITFRAKASQQRSITQEILQDTSPWAKYMTQNVTLTTAWTTYTYSFTSPLSVADTELNFNVAQATGTIWIDNISMYTD